MTTAGPGDLVTFGPLLLAIPVAAAAGVVSFLSPCCLPLVPGYLAYVTGSAGAEAHHRGPAPTGPSDPAPTSESAVAVRTRTLRPGRTVFGTVLFIVGFAAVFTSYGAAFGAIGTVLVTHQDAVYRVLGVVTIALGLMFAGVFSRVPLAGRTIRLGYRPKLGVAGAPMLGVLFGVGWTPCIGPTLAAVLTLSTSTGGAGRGAVLSFAYSLGLGIPFLLAAVGMTRAFTLFAFARRHARAVMRAGGLLLVVVGLLEVTGVWSALIARMQPWLASWQPPL